jgi:hypothetical protein
LRWPCRRATFRNWDPCYEKGNSGGRSGEENRLPERVNSVKHPAGLCHASGKNLSKAWIPAQKRYRNDDLRIRGQDLTPIQLRLALVSVGQGKSAYKKPIVLLILIPSF